MIAIGDTVQIKPVYPLAGRAGRVLTVHVDSQGAEMAYMLDLTLNNGSTLNIPTEYLETSV